MVNPLLVAMAVCGPSHHLSSTHYHQAPIIGGRTQAMRHAIAQRTYNISKCSQNPKYIICDNWCGKRTKVEHTYVNAYMQNTRECIRIGTHYT